MNHSHRTNWLTPARVARGAAQGQRREDRAARPLRTILVNALAALLLLTGGFPLLAHPARVAAASTARAVDAAPIPAVPAPAHAGPQGNGTSVTPNGWDVTPAGSPQVTLGDKPFGLALSPDARTLLVSNDGESTQSIQVVDAATGEVRQTIPYTSPQALFIGLAFSPDGTRAYASAGGNNKIRVYNVQGQRLTESTPISIPLSSAPPNPFPAGLTLAPDGKTLYAADNLGDALSVVDTASGRATAAIPVGPNPYAVALSHDGRAAYVSDWGGQTVSVVDTAALTVTQTITVGTHPGALAVNPARAELYVANNDADSVSVIDTTTNAVVRTIDLAPYPHAPVGANPNALTVSPDGRVLYVANAGDNDVAVIDLAHGAGMDHIRGLIPTAWYPTGLAVSPDGGRLYVENAKGLGAGPNPHGPNSYTDAILRTSPDPKVVQAWDDQYVGAMIKGTLSFVDVPDDAQLARDTQQVVTNNGFDQGEHGGTGTVIPRHPGDPSPIKHVIYIVKENRTYDQVLGDLPGANGDPALTLFPEAVTPNQHALARQFVTLDNLYADGEVSADGWYWSAGANANPYVQKTWPSSYTDYSSRNRTGDTHPFATAPNADPYRSFIWDRAIAAGVSLRHYGWWTDGNAPHVHVRSIAPELAPYTDPNYTGFNMNVTDRSRVVAWKQEYDAYEATHTLPAFELMWLGDDHTNGIGPTALTPSSMLADNDLALGQLVETVSHSPDWKDTAIFVVEDDAQAGPDHVDGHRMIAQVISPYTQIGRVDSSFYSTVSVLRTMGLILGLKPLTQFDAAATPMLNSFTDHPSVASYTAITPTQPLDELNPTPVATPSTTPVMGTTTPGTTTPAAGTPTAGTPTPGSGGGGPTATPTMTATVITPIGSGGGGGTATPELGSGTLLGGGLLAMGLALWRRRRRGARDDAAMGATLLGALLLVAAVPAYGHVVRPSSPTVHAVSGAAAAPVASRAAATPTTPRVQALQAAWEQASARMFSGPLGHIPDAQNPQLLNRAIWYSTKGWTRPYPGDKTVLTPQEVLDQDHYLWQLRPDLGARR